MGSRAEPWPVDVHRPHQDFLADLAVHDDGASVPFLGADREEGNTMRRTGRSTKAASGEVPQPARARLRRQAALWWPCAGFLAVASVAAAFAFMGWLRLTELADEVLANLVVLPEPPSSQPSSGSDAREAPVLTQARVAGRPKCRGHGGDGAGVAPLPRWRTTFADDCEPFRSGHHGLGCRT
jgi:hypothetical protein